jgi:hypothetical protein
MTAVCCCWLSATSTSASSISCSIGGLISSAAVDSNESKRLSRIRIQYLRLCSAGTRHCHRVSAEKNGYPYEDTDGSG